MYTYLLQTTSLKRLFELYILALMVIVPRCLGAKATACLGMKMGYMTGYTSDEYLWQVRGPAQSEITCGFLCERDSTCKSFSFHSASTVCKGYSKLFGDTSEATEDGASVYYIMECRCKMLEITLLFPKEHSINFDTISYILVDPNLHEASHPFAIVELEIAQQRKYPVTTNGKQKEIAAYGDGMTLGSGIFRCWEKGLYKFHLTGFPDNCSSSVRFELYHNSNPVVTATSNGCNTGGNTAILTLELGDEVRVLQSGPAYGGNDQFTTFNSGFLRNGNLGSFTVALSEDAHVQPNDVIVYNHVITDTPDMYDSETGVVTISGRGVYAIHFYAMAEEDTPLFLDLYHNDKYICSLHASADTGRIYTGNSVVLDLTPYDKISIRSRIHTYFGGPPAINPTTLSGHCVSTEDEMTKNNHDFLSNASVCCLEHNKEWSDSTRKLRESYWIRRLNTLCPFGINKGEIDCWDGLRPKAYSGKMNETKNNRVCQSWSEQYPHSHDYTMDASYPCDGYVAGALNYCRDPGSNSTPWCYTLDLEVPTEACNVTLCSTIKSGREVVAFSVALTHAATVLGGTKILFNHTLYDTNCDYDRFTGNFVASSTGPYEFNFHLTGHPHGGTIWFELWKNERYLVSAYGTRTSHSPTASNAAQVRLNKGDIAYIKAHDGYDSVLHGASDEILCIFSGYLLR